jgi:hypothetical protein
MSFGREHEKGEEKKEEYVKKIGKRPKQKGT